MGDVKIDRARLVEILGEDKVQSLESGADVEMEPTEWERFKQMTKESYEHPAAVLTGGLAGGFILAGKMFWRGAQLTKIFDWS